MIEDNKKRAESHVKKLVNSLSKKGITFSQEDGHLPNVVFSCKEKRFPISWEWFYRVSGICSYRVPVGEHFFKDLPMDDDMFYNSFTRAIVEFVFYPPEKK